MVFVSFLGTASGVPTPGRFNTSICLTVKAPEGRAHYLVDCGEPATTLLQDAGIDRNEIRAIFITHMHSDHIGGLFQLLQTMQVRDRLAPLRLLVPGEAVQAMRDFLVAAYMPPENLPFTLTIDPIQPGPFHDDGVMRAEAFANRHLDWVRRRLEEAGAKHPRLRFECYSLRLRLGGKTIVCSGDLDEIQELERPIAGGCDLLILEMAHVKAAHLTRWAAGLAAVSRIAVTHVHPDVSGDRFALAAQLADTGVSAEMHLVEDGGTLILR